MPASLDARRFFVLEVSEAHANDHDWFAAIWREMEAGGYEAMLHDLLRHDLTGFNVRRVPVTEALQTQKIKLPTSEAWWLDVLQRGYVYRSKLGLEHEFGNGPARYPPKCCSQLYRLRQGPARAAPDEPRDVRPVHAARRSTPTAAQQKRRSGNTSGMYPPRSALPAKPPCDAPETDRVSIRGIGRCPPAIPHSDRAEGRMARHAADEPRGGGNDDAA